MSDKNYIEKEKEIFTYLSEKKIDKLDAIIHRIATDESLTESEAVSCALLSQISDYLAIDEVMATIENIKGVVIGRAIYFHPFNEVNKILHQIKDTLGKEILKDVKNGRTYGPKAVCIALKNMKK